MDITQLSQKPAYASGAIVEADNNRLRAIIEKGEDILGLEHRHCGFSILYLPDNFIARRGVNAAYSAEENKFATTKNQHEATLFHEGIHYLMSQEGLLFGPSLEKATFYDRLVDETVAEFATSDVYGYTEAAGDLMGFYESLKEGKPEALEALLGQGLSKEMISMIESTIRTMDFLQLEIAKRQREIERKYGEKRDFKAITGEVNSLYEFMSSLSGPFAWTNMSEAVKIVSVGNAVELRKNSVQPKDLVAWIKDGVAKGWDSYGLYFCDVVGSIK